jgi:ADP-heptose:LPS heptosyltransferase
MIILSPYAKTMRNGKQHPKNYPYWEEVIAQVKEHIVQVGVEGEVPLVADFRQNLSLEDLAELIKECKTWMGIDSFFQHYCWDQGKPGIVLWGQSDPVIFGHPENVNLLKDRKYLREKQFWLWEQCEFNAESFVTHDVVLEALESFGVELK